MKVTTKFIILILFILPFNAYCKRNGFEFENNTGHKCFLTDNFIYYGKIMAWPTTIISPHKTGELLTLQNILHPNVLVEMTYTCGGKRITIDCEQLKNEELKTTKIMARVIMSDTGIKANIENIPPLYFNEQSRIRVTLQTN